MHTLRVGGEEEEMNDRPPLQPSIKGIRRRRFLGYTGGMSALSLLGWLFSCSVGKETPGLRYIRAVHRTLDRIRKEERNSIRDAANLFARTIISRNLCFLATAHPSNPGYLNEDTPGMPRIFVYLRSREMAETLRSGDALLATSPGEMVRVARMNGAKIAGFCSPSVPDCYGPEDRNQLAPGEGFAGAARPLIRSFLPVWDGMVNLPEYPFGVLPGSGPVEMTAVTALAGETYRRSERTVRIEHARSRDAFEYIGEVMRRLRLLEDQSEAALEAAETAAKKILNRGVLRVYDRRGGLTRELESGAGIPTFVRPITEKGITDSTLRPIDSLVFASLESNQPEDLHLIRMARGVTNAITTICPREGSGGYRIYNEAPSSLNNLSPEREGVRKFDNNTRTFLHTGGVLNAVSFWMLIGEITGKLIAAGRIPLFSMGAHLAGSEEHNADVRARAERGEFFAGR